VDRRALETLSWMHSDRLENCGTARMPRLLSCALSCRHFEVLVVAVEVVPDDDR